jgi:hypothetical protein
METGLKPSNAASSCNRIVKSIVLLENIFEFKGKYATGKMARNND